MVFKKGQVGYWKGKTFSEEHRKRLSEIRIKEFKEGTRVGLIRYGKDNPMYGRHHSKESREKISKGHIGLKQSIESIKKRIEKTKGTIRKKGNHWKLSEETKQRMSNSLIGNSRNLGKTFSEEHKRKIGEGNKGKELSKETINKIKLARTKQIVPVKDTTIEIKIQNFLEQLGIEYFTHKHMKEIEHSYQCDIFIPSMNLVIECDGNYWHSYPIGKDIDHIRTKELIEKGFGVLRLWELEIRSMDLENFKRRLNI